MLGPENKIFFLMLMIVDMHMIIKVADFGLLVNTGAKDYYRLAGDMGIKLPIKWMAPESLSDYLFSEKSDVISDEGHNSMAID